NLVERLAILYPGETITNGKLPERYQLKHGIEGSAPGTNDSTEPLQPAAFTTVDVGSGIDLKQYLTDLERNLIESALRNSDWVVAKAAKSLSLQRTTLVEKIKKLEIHSPSV
ncbi:MAG TPA: helix-turn-helix domain-containing protein, partial [Hyphomicrobiales bacterium]|nr:helix-turn-helix domain-containing protein [Hyphomicrobiales bacterium]